MRPFSRRIWIDIYATEILLSISDNILKTSPYYNRVFMPWKPDGCPTALSRFSRDGNDYGLFLSRDNIYHADLAHEICHIACRMLWNKDIEFTGDADEPLAYLIDNITGKVYTILKQNQIEITI